MARRRKPDERQIPYATILFTTLALAAGSFVILADDPAYWFRRFGLIPRLFWSGEGLSWFQEEQWYKPFTALLLHLDWMHLLGNLAFFWLFAQRIERRTGPVWFLILVLGCGVLANIFSAWRFPDSTAPIIGASGATAALLGAFLVLYPTARIGVIFPLGFYWQLVRVPGIALIGSWFGLQLLYSLSSDRVEEIAWWSHIGGFISGFLLSGFGRLTGIARR